MVRYLTSDISGDPGFQLPSYVVVFLQNIFGTLFLLPFVIKKGIHSIKTSFPGLESIRVLFSVFGLILWYASLAHMQIAEAVALAFTGPIITIIASRFCLKESLSPLRLMAICISFIGAFMIMRPDRALFSQEGLMAQLGLLIFLPLLSAAAFSGAKISGRALARKGESATVMTFYLLVFMAPISFIPAFFVWATPSLEQLGWLAMMGAFSTAAHLALARSFALADISFLTPFGFARLMLSGLVGYIAFGELPQTLSIWIGMGVILLSILLLSYDAKKRGTGIEI